MKHYDGWECLGVRQFKYSDGKGKLITANRLDYKNDNNQVGCDWLGSKSPPQQVLETIENMIKRIESRLTCKRK